MKHNYIKSMLTAVLLLCAATASAQIEVDGLYFSVDGKNCSVTKNPSGTLYTGDIVIPESVTANSASFADFSIYSSSTDKTTEKTYTFYAEAGGTISFKFSSDLGNIIWSTIEFNGDKTNYPYHSGMKTHNIDITTTGIQTLVFGTKTTMSGNPVTLKVSDFIVDLNADVEFLVTGIKEAFKNCTGLKSIEIPNSVTNIDYMAFYGCTGLKSIKMPDNLTAIGSNAFTNCSGLTSIKMPDNLTAIGHGAFSGCI